MAAGRIALVVAGNQPLYPLYLHWLVGGGALAACGTWASTPGFLAVAWCARRHGLAARIGLVLVGAGNTLWSAKLLGAGSGVGLFLIPCALIALLGLRRGEWLVLALLLLGVAAVGALLPWAGAVPLARLDAAQMGHLARINLFSAACLALLAGWLLGRAH